MACLTIQELSKLVTGTLFINHSALDDVVRGVAIDSRKIESGNLFVPIKGEHVDGHQFIASIEDKASLFFIQDEAYAPKNKAYIVVDDTIKALQELAQNFRQTLMGEIIGITGSNGKTSCKDIMASVLDVRYKVAKTQGNRNNEIGVPLTLLSFDQDIEKGIVEMGLEKKGDLHFLNPIVAQDVAIITSIGDAHIVHLGSQENVARGKLEIIDGLKPGSLFLYNGDDPTLQKILLEKDIGQLETIKYGFKETNDIYIRSLAQSEKGIMFQTNQSATFFFLPLFGKHMALNALPTMALAYRYGYDDEAIQAGFSSLHPTAMRNELIKIHACTVLNDAYKSNPQSALAALDTFEGFKSPYKLAVLGDMLDLGPQEARFHEALGRSLKNYTLDEVLCFGECSKHTFSACQEVCPHVKLHHFMEKQALIEYLSPYLDKECMILFKGSRGMALDEVILALQEMGETYE